MSSWRNGRGFQWQPVKLWWWWTPCLRELRQCWNIMVATQNIDPLEPIWTFSPRGVVSFVASDSDIINVLSSFEGTANLQCYTSCKLTTLHCIKVSFLQGCPIKRYNKIFAEMWGVYRNVRGVLTFVRYCNYYMYCYAIVNSRVCTRVIDTFQTLPLALIGCVDFRSSGFLQIKLQPLGGATDSGFVHSRPVSYSTIRT